MKSIAICLFALFLTGCADRLAGWIAYEGELEARGRAWVDERHLLRQEIRRRCKESLWREVDTLEAEGRFEESRNVLALNYPNLFTVDVLQAYRSGDLAGLDDPWGCQVSGLPE